MTNDVLKNRPKYIFAIVWFLTFWVATIIVQLPLIFVDELSSSMYILVTFIQGFFGAYLFCELVLFLYNKISKPDIKSNMPFVLRNQWFFSFKSTIFFIVIFGFTFYNDFNQGKPLINGTTFIILMILFSPAMMKFLTKDIKVVE